MLSVNVVLTCVQTADDINVINKFGDLINFKATEDRIYAKSR